MSSFPPRRGGFIIPVLASLLVEGCSLPNFDVAESTWQTLPSAPPHNAEPTVAAPEPPTASSPTKTEVIRGNQRFLAPASRTNAVSESTEGTVSLHFVNVEVHDIAKAIIGDILGLNYVVESSARGNVTVETTQPVGREAVLSALEAGLKTAGMGLVTRRNGSYSIMSLNEARRQPGLLDDTVSGYGTEAVPLHYVNAAALKKLLDPIVPESSIQADSARNVLLINGSGSERQSLREMVRQFDVNWMAGMSFALITLQYADSRQLAGELDQIINADGSPSAGMVRLVPLTRLNGIAAVSPQPRYLDEVRRLAEDMDREGDEGERRLFVYHVQNTRAVNLVAVLTDIFGSGSSDNQPGQSGVPHNSGTTASGSGTLTNPSQALSLSPASSMPSSPGSSSSSSSSKFSNDSFDSLSSQVSSNGKDTQGGSNGQQLRLGQSRQTISVTSDPTNNAIVIYATTREYQLIEQALRKLDVLPLQVIIEAMITEVSLNDKLTYGVEWYFKNGDSHFSLASGSTNLPVQNFPGFSYLLSNSSSIQAVVNALDDVTKVNVVASPNLMVLNNQTAMIMSGDQVPVVTASSSSTVTANSAVVNSIDYRDTGVILKVTPRVNNSGLVLLDIAQEVSDVTTTTSSDLNTPTFEQRKVSTSVAVRDGQTVVLGGMIRDNLSREDAGVPWLKDVPILGRLFDYSNHSRVRSELLVLLTPRVIRNDMEVQAVTEELRRKMSAVEPLPPPKETDQFGGTPQP